MRIESCSVEETGQKRATADSARVPRRAPTNHLMSFTCGPCVHRSSHHRQTLRQHLDAGAFGRSVAAPRRPCRRCRRVFCPRNLPPPRLASAHAVVPSLLQRPSASAILEAPTSTQAPRFRPPLTTAVPKQPTLLNRSSPVRPNGSAIRTSYSTCLLGTGTHPRDLDRQHTTERYRQRSPRSPPRLAAGTPGLETTLPLQRHVVM
jgi:hypothetical protein